MDLAKGRRVYVPSKTTFGTVIKQGGILGLSSSYAVVDDIGNRMVYFGEKADIVYVDTKQNPCGRQVEIPHDVVDEIRKTHTPQEAKKMTDELYALCPDERVKAFDEKKKTRKKVPKKSNKNSVKKLNKKSNS